MLSKEAVVVFLLSIFQEHGRTYGFSDKKNRKTFCLIFCFSVVG